MCHIQRCQRETGSKRFPNKLNPKAFKSPKLEMCLSCRSDRFKVSEQSGAMKTQLRLSEAKFTGLNWSPALVKNAAAARRPQETPAFSESFHWTPTKFLHGDCGTV